LSVTNHNAVDSYLGFAHQTLSALTLLLDAGDDESVTLELTDDVTVHHPSPHTPHAPVDTRHQISHTIGASPAEMTLKSVKLWKTIGIWAAEYDEKERYILVTCAPICQELKCLADNTNRGPLQTLLEEEARRVVHEHDQKLHKHQDREPACKAFLSLNGKVREALLSRIILCAHSPNIALVDGVLDNLLKNLATPEKRHLIIVRLREFWFNRVTKSLSGELPRRITKRELQQQIEEIHNEVTGPGLPDNFGDLKPPVDSETPDLMRKQIELVDGGAKRIVRARKVRWQSRNQRQRWMDEKVTFWAQLDKFDQKLIDAWSDRHGPMCDDTVAASESDKRRRGCEILDWTHNDAASTLIQVGTKVAPPFLVQGTYQQLADERRVGWHPDYETLLPTPEKTDEDN